MRRLRWLVFAPIALAVTVPLYAQSPVYPSARGGAGAIIRTYTFQNNIDLDRVTQFATQQFLGFPVGRRLFVDVSSAYAITNMRAQNGTETDVSGFTDTQVRASYTLGRDLAVFSVSVNLPTGDAEVATEELAVVSTVGQNFLPFPVTSYGTALGVTSGLAVAQRLGSWNVGVAGAVRYTDSYTPVAGGGDYRPGVEVRARLGVNRLLGQRTRLTAGFTFSTFSSDEFGQTAIESLTAFSPGNRYIGQLALARQIGRSTLQLYSWGFTRSAGAGSSAQGEFAGASEGILHQGLQWAIPVGRGMLDPGVENRFWFYDGSESGRLTGVRLGLRVPAGRVTIAPAIRYDDGTIELPGDPRASLTGLRGQLFIQVSR